MLWAYFSLYTLQFLLLGTQIFFFSRAQSTLYYATDHVVSSLITLKWLCSGTSRLNLEIIEEKGKIDKP